jgi:hypothetical protein
MSGRGAASCCCRRSGPGRNAAAPSGQLRLRWFATPQQHWPEFLDLCAPAWPGFESAYDSQVIGLWQAIGDRTGTDNDEVTGAGMHSGVRSLLLTHGAQPRDVGALEAAGRQGESRKCATC